MMRLHTCDYREWYLHAYIFLLNLKTCLLHLCLDVGSGNFSNVWSSSSRVSVLLPTLFYSTMVGHATIKRPDSPAVFYTYGSS